MANAAQLAQTTPARVLIVGYPGTAKTGALSALVNAGLKLRIAAFDKMGNMQPLFTYSDPSKLKNVDIVALGDKLKGGKKFIEVDGAPTAFATGVKLLNRWKYTNPDGTETDLGASADWGLDTVFVLDSLTSMGDAAMRRARFINNRTIMDTTDRVYGLAMAEQDAFLEALVSSENRFHVIVLSHLKIIGPRDVRKGDDDLTERIKRDMADIVPTRLFPSALGWQLPQQVGRHFPTILEAETKVRGKEVRRVLKTVTTHDLDLKIPAKSIPAEMPVDTGLVTVFDAVSPGWRDAVKKGAETPVVQQEKKE